MWAMNPASRPIYLKQRDRIAVMILDGTYPEKRGAAALGQGVRGRAAAPVGAHGFWGPRSGSKTVPE